MIPEKLRTNFLRRTIPKTGPFPTDGYNSGQGELAVDLANVTSHWNTYAYPLLLSLPRGSDETRWAGATAVPEPLVDGLDGDTMFLNDDVASGIWWSSDNLRPLTVYEAAVKLNGFINELRTEIGSASTTGSTLIAHASSHSENGSDEVLVENLGTAAAAGYVPQSDGSGGLTMAAAPAPGVHASTHSQGGGDEVEAEDLGTSSTTSGELLVTDGIGGWYLGNPAPQSHATSHQNGGSDEISVVGLSGLLADGQTPLTHASTHSRSGLGGTDSIDLDDLSSGVAADGAVLTANGSGAAAWEASSGTPTGTVTGSTLYWNGSAWTESEVLTNDGTDAVSIRQELRLLELAVNGNNYVGFKAPDNMTSGDTIWTLPDDDGNSGDVLETNGAGTLSWTVPAGGSGMTTYVTVAAAEAASGSDNDLCYVVEEDSIYRYESAASAYTRDSVYVLNTGDAGNTRWLAQAGKYSIFKVRGKKALTVGTGFSTTVTILPAMPDANYTVHLSLEYNDVSTASQYAYVVDVGKTSSSFDVIFSGAIDGNYYLHWVVEAD